MSLPKPIYIDGDYTVPNPVSAPVFSSPLPGVAAQVVLTQVFQQFNEWFEPTALNTPYPTDLNPDYEDFVLCSESERQDIGGAIVSWTRTYAKVPDTRYEGTSMTFNFPGLVGTYTTPGTSSTFNVTLRLSQTLPVTSKMRVDYFLCGTGGSYSDLSLIPVIQHTRFYLPIMNGVSEVGKQDVTILDTATVPTTAEYQADQAGGLFDIVAQDSQVTRWMGNIFQRTTLYIPAL